MSTSRHQKLFFALRVKSKIIINQPTNQPTNQSTNQSINQSINQSMNQSFISRVFRELNWQFLKTYPIPKRCCVWTSRPISWTLKLFLSGSHSDSDSAALSRGDSIPRVIGKFKGIPVPTPLLRDCDFHLP